MKLSKIFIAMFCASIITGCAGLGGKSMPDNIKNPLPEIYDKMVSEWKQQEPPITFIESNTGFLIQKRKQIPQEILDINLKNLSLYGETFEDLIFSLKGYGLNLYISEEAIGNISSSVLKLNTFNGNVGELFSIIEKVHNVSFNFQSDKNIILEQNSLFLSPVPQDEDAAKELVSTIESLGGKNVNYSLASGFMMYKASNTDYETIAEYLIHYYKNFATIKLQVAVITVTMSKDRNTGFDWGQLQASIGNLSLNKAVDSIGDAVGDVATTPLGSNLKDLTALGSITSESGGALLQKGDLDVKAVFNLLSKYGKTTATQSIFLETISGKKLELVNTKEVPYTSNINSSISSTNNTTNASGFNTASEQEGLNIKFSPYFNFTKNTVTMSLEMDLKTITGFKQLNAGNGNGTVEQPETQQQKFNSVVEIIPGSAHLVGGIMYELDKDNRENINFLDSFDTASQKTTKSNNALFILLRPTVTIYSDLDDVKGKNSEK